MKKKILVIDDDEHIREYLVSLFSNNGYDVAVAEDGKKGLARAKKMRPDLITLDIEMPGEWGPRFYHRLSQEAELKAIPVIVISGLPGHQRAVEKAAACVSKPFDRDKLLKIVEQILT
jgi:CheY-like chemotaxis protein